MSSSVRELYAWYPFLPAVSADAAVKNIRDVHIEYVLAAREPSSGTTCTDGIVATLVSVSQTDLSILLEIPEYSVSQTLTVPIYVGIDTIPTTATYAIAYETPQSTTLSRTYRLHPDCLVLRQTPPSIALDLRYNYSMDPETTDETSAQHTLTSLTFTSGHHVAVSASEAGLVLTGGTGKGLGEWSTYPFREFLEYGYRNADGLRSINGLVDDVSLSAKGSDITVTTAGTADVTVTIGHN